MTVNDVLNLVTEFWGDVCVCDQFDEIVRLCIEVTGERPDDDTIRDAQNLRCASADRTPDQMGGQL